MRVSELMRTDGITVHRERSLNNVVKLFILKDIGGVVALDDNGDPAGVVTRSRMMHVIYQADAPVDEIRVMNVTKSPEVKVKPNMTARKAARRMAEEGQDTAFVMDGLEIVGVISLYDILADDAVALQRTDENIDRSDW